MKIVKSELQNIITGNGQTGDKCLIKKSQVYLSGNEIPSFQNPKIQPVKSEEERSLIHFIESNALFYKEPVEDQNFIGEGAEDSGRSMKKIQNGNVENYVLIMSLAIGIILVVNFILQ